MVKLHLTAQLGDFAHGVLQQLHQAGGRFQGLDVQGHLVVGHGPGDDQTHALDLGEALGHFNHLPGLHEHAAHFGGLVCAAQPAFDAHIGAACRAVARQDGGKVARAKTDQRVVGVQGGDDQLADLALWHRVAGAGAHDFDDHAFIHHQALPGFGFVSDQAQVGGGIALVAGHATLLHPLLQRRWEGFGREQGLAQAGQGGAHGLGFFQNQFQKTGGADVASGLQFGHGLHLLLGLARAAGKDAAADGMGTVFHHGPGGDKVVAKAIVNQLAAAKSGGVDGAGHAPVVFALAFGLVNGAGAGKNARHGRAKTVCCKAAKGIGAALGLLALQELVFARDRQLGQRSAAGDAGGINASQNVRKGWTVFLRMGNLPRQRSQQGRFAFLWGAGFKGVVKRRHGHSFQGILLVLNQSLTIAEYMDEAININIQANQRLRRL